MLLIAVAAGTTSALGQRSFAIEIMAERLDLSPLFSTKTLENPEQVVLRTTHLQDSLPLDSTHTTWLALQCLKAKAFLDWGKPGKTKNTTHRLLSLTNSDKNTYLHRIVLLTHSFTLHINDGQDEEPIQYLLKAVELAHDNNDYQLELDICLHIADMYIDLYRRDIACEWTDRAGRVLPHIYTAANCHGYYVVAADARNPQVTDHMGRLVWSDPVLEKEAFSFIHKAIECGVQAQQEGDDKYINVPLGYHIRADFWRTPAEHVFYFRKTLGESQKRKDKWAIFWGQLRLIKAYLTANSPDSAKLYIDSCRGLTRYFNQQEDMMPVFYRACISYHEYMDNADSLVKYLKLSHAAENKIATNQTLVEIEKNKARFYDAQQKITILEQEAELAVSNRKRRNLYVALAFFLLTGLLLSIFVVRVRAANRTIKATAAQLEKMVQEKIVLVQEVNHRVKNNLQMITTFIDMQARGVKELETLEFGNGIRKRVRAVSLVHELMLEEERLTGILFKDYVHQLVNELESMHYSGDEFIPNIEIDETSFGLSATMYLGILLNELVSNSIKHASKKGAPLEIWISLKKTNNHYALAYGDSGIGIPEMKRGENGKSLGLYIIDSMARQLDGSRVKDPAHPGWFVMEFPIPDDVD